jgi:lipopolysaccharide export system protein LptA
MTRLSHRRLILALAFLPMALGAVEARAQSSADLFKGFQTNQKGPVNVEADSLDVVEKDGQRISTFTGNVTVTRGDSVLKAGKISIYSAGSKPADGAKENGAKTAAAKEDAALEGTLPGAGSFTRIEASGKVYVNSGQQTATGDNAVVDMVGKLVTLSGNVVLSQGPNVITGNKLTWDMTTGRARVDQTPGARIRGIFTPGSAPGKTP